MICLQSCFSLNTDWKHLCLRKSAVFVLFSTLVATAPSTHAEEKIHHSPKEKKEIYIGNNLKIKIPKVTISDIKLKPQQ